MNNGIATDSKNDSVDFLEYLPEKSLDNLNSQEIDLMNLGFLKTKQGYFYQDLSANNPLFEMVLIIWPGGTGSQAHDHGNCLSLSTIIPFGQTPNLTAKLHKIFQGQFFPDGEKTLKPGEFDVVLPFQVHEIDNPNQEAVMTLHVYIPRRK
ncbi:hypothetical protein [Merismopedia glauca]|uniref:Cysteine dioxygenase n=1 Tax=Merismopedia glauca CCAP 1448/3 TaxID=1296344 RepID=A0A2T1C1F0_9CYAN|nr:hypothetical protein [Merismopedia glauca]PSB02099.1 hypothetical protein C7B64_14835 [Merismopedia glauca CCAP 1448/3]